MRSWITLIENSIDFDFQQRLYHGTPTENMLLILAAGQINFTPSLDYEKDIHSGVSLTTNIEVAKGFAHSDNRDGDILRTEFMGKGQVTDQGAILTINPSSLKITHIDMDHSAEAEWRTHDVVPVSLVTEIRVFKHDLTSYVSDFKAAKSRGFDQSLTVFNEQDWSDFFNNSRLLNVIENIETNPLIKYY